MEGKIYKLTFHGPVHFGSGRLESAAYTCDAATLFSALFIEAHAAGCSDELLEAANLGTCLISDCFPYIENTYYLPKPLGAFHTENECAEQSEDSRSRKAGKKLSYIPADQLNNYMDGNFDFIREWENFKLGKSFVRMKVNLTHATSDNTELFPVGGFSFLPGCGIYFIYQGKYDITPLMDALAYSGLGGKRSSGYGAFNYTVESAGCVKEIQGSSNNAYMLLSSAATQEACLNDELLQNARYKLERRGGFVQSVTHAPTQRKKRDMWVFKPGSVFTKQFSGDVFDVNNTPGSHAVYRYARAMWMEV